VGAFLWGSEQLVNSTTDFFQTSPVVTAVGNRGFVIAWMDRSSTGADTSQGAIRLQRFDPVGKRIGPETLVNTTTDENQSEADILGLAGDAFVVAWTDDGADNNDVRFRRFSGDGTPIDAADRLAAGSIDFEGESSLSRAGVGFALGFRDSGNGDDFNVARFDAVGRLISPVIPVAATENRESPGVVTQLSNGDLAVAWDDGTLGRIRTARYSSTGTLLSGPTNVSATANTGHDEPAITALANGGYVVTWSDFSAAFPDTSSFAIRARLYSNAGVAFGSEFVVNTLTANVQDQSTVTPLADGGFAVAYRSNSDIRLQLFDAFGTRRGTEFLVNTTTSAAEQAPDIALLADGRLVVTWQGNDSDFAGIYAQIVDPRDGLCQGSDTADTVHGNLTFANEIRGIGGDDVLFGGSAGDQIYGGEGNDDAFGRKGDDVLYGGLGVDTLLGEAGDDDLFGEDGNDDLRGGAGADGLDGGTGLDTANYGAATASVVAALDGSLAGIGDAAGDSFVSVEFIRGANVGGPGDVLRGDGAANSLLGNAGNDRLESMAGSDKLMGGVGTDTLTGGLGNDQFLFDELAEVPDTILDFSSNAAGNNDMILFKGTAFGGLARGAIAANQFEANSVGVATLATTRFIFDTDSEVLRFDSNGNVSGGATVVAFLQVGATMTFSDIAIF
jgi:Ca2+-binding RTX toxin-like protein